MLSRVYNGDMKKSLLWFVLVIAVIIAGYLGIRAQKAEQRAQKAEQRAQKAENTLAEQDRLKKLAEPFLSVWFVRREGTTLVYRGARQVTVDNTQFVNYPEQQATLSDTVNVFGPAAENRGPAALDRLTENTVISISLTNDAQGNPVIGAVYIAP